MARVYLASDRVLERQVASGAQPALCPDPSFVERFRHEARIAARLSHPNLVAVFDSGSDANQHYLVVMEYVAGQSLAELLADQGRLAPRRVAELGVEVCSALAAAHAEGLVYRDVKPANVLVGEDVRVKVTDFGIVKAGRPGRAFRLLPGHAGSVGLAG